MCKVKLNYVSMKLLSLGEIFTFDALDFKFNFHSRFALEINFAFHIFNSSSPQYTYN